MPKNYANYDHSKYLADQQHQEDCRKVFGGSSPLSSSSPPQDFYRPPPAEEAGMHMVRDIFSELLDDHSQEGKVQFMAALLHTLNAPVVKLDGLTPLHWLGLNPLVILGAPTGHLGPLPPPTLPSEDPNLHQTISDVVSGAVGDQFRFGLEPLETLSEEVRSGFESTDNRFAEIEKKLAFLARLSLSSPVPASKPSSPPSSTPAAALAQDVEMAHPPAPAPVVAPVAAPVAPPPTPAPAAVAPVPAVPTPAPVSKPRAKKPHAQPPTPVPAKAQPASAKAKSAPAPTPAPVTRPTPPPASKPSFAFMAKTPARPSLVVSLRPPVAGAAIPQAVRRSPQEIVSHLNAVLSSEGHQVSLSAARWTVKNNLVVTAGPDTTAHHLASASHLISDSLAVYLSADQSPLPVQARENCKWARLLINGIPTGVSLTRGPYAPSELTAALLADNPVCRGLRMTLPPSWVRAPASYTPGSTSSIVLTFEDPSGDSLRSLMAERTLFAFGHSGELKRWKAKPRNTGKGTPAASS
ncbi:hypothetical protein EDB89DRAFT_1910409 [Lactarius sanguifluus]|nr:hypothetical protein EDB89DRAFT_1910409 [Lactarius sanguifluus]